MASRIHFTKEFLKFLLLSCLVTKKSSKIEVSVERCVEPPVLQQLPRQPPDSSPNFARFSALIRKQPLNMHS